jgi:hemolysin activation/secretion protein
MYHFYLNQKNNISLRSQNYYLKSDTYLTNELYRFGGINSIRGFRENNLQGNFFASILSEYRYIIASNLYLYSIIDYGYYQDQTTKLEDSLLGLGLGFSILTKNGQFNLIYANGSSGNQEFDLSNSIIQINFQSRF